MSEVAHIRFRGGSNHLVANLLCLRQFYDGRKTINYSARSFKLVYLYCRQNVTTTTSGVSPIMHFTSTVRQAVKTRTDQIYNISSPLRINPFPSTKYTWIKPETQKSPHSKNYCESQTVAFQGNNFKNSLFAQYNITTR